jgi:RNA polymerase sigma-70 factor, ECF subfamily
VDETAPRSDASLPADQEEAAPAAPAIPVTAAIPAAPAAPEPAAPAAPELVTDAQRARQLQQVRDGALIERALDGELEAFNEIVILYQDYLFALVVRVVGDRDSAADAVQEAFFSCYRNLNRFRGDSFRSWLTRIALNAATDVLRQRKRRPSEPFPEWEDDAWQPPALESDNPERQAMRRNAARALTTALEQITDDQRAAIVLYDVEGYDYQEIADMTGAALGTVKSRIHRGRLALRELLGDDVELLRE